MTVAAHPAREDYDPSADRRFALEIACLLVLMAVGFIVAAFAVQACTT